MEIYQPSFFYEANRLVKLTELNDPLVELQRHIDFEWFRPQLSEVFAKDRKSAAGRKAYDVVSMFKILILQRVYNISDEQAEFQINDSYTFQRFLGLRLGTTVPDFSTVWLFRVRPGVGPLHGYIQGRFSRLPLVAIGWCSHVTRRPLFAARPLCSSPTNRLKLSRYGRKFMGVRINRKWWGFEKFCKTRSSPWQLASMRIYFFTKSLPRGIGKSLSCRMYLESDFSACFISAHQCP